MAKVAMDLNELKALETKIDNLERDNQNLIDNQKMVVVLHKYFTGTVKPGKTNDGSLRITGIRATRSMRSIADYGGMRHVDAMTGRMVSNEYREEMFDNEVGINDAISRGWVDVVLTEDSTRHSREYINLNEVKEELRVLTGVEYDQKIEELRDRANKAEYELSAIDDKHLKRLRSVTEGYQNDLEKLKKSRDKELTDIETNHESALRVTIAKWTDRHKILQDKFDTLEEDYDLLKTDKKRETLEQKVREMSQELYKLKTRGFWDRMFNR